MSETAKMVIAIVRVWHQTSADYAAEASQHAYAFAPETPLCEVLRWRDALTKNSLGHGDLVLVQPAPRAPEVTP